MNADAILKILVRQQDLETRTQRTQRTQAAKGRAMSSERYLLMLEVTGQDCRPGAIRLRSLLKLALRVFGLKCVEARETTQGDLGGDAVTTNQPTITGPATKTKRRYRTKRKGANNAEVHPAGEESGD